MIPSLCHGACAPKLPSCPLAPPVSTPHREDSAAQHPELTAPGGGEGEPFTMQSGIARQRGSAEESVLGRRAESEEEWWCEAGRASGCLQQQHRDKSNLCAQLARQARGSAPETEGRAQRFSWNNLLNTALKFVFMNSIIKNKTLSHIYIYIFKDNDNHSINTGICCAGAAQNGTFSTLPLKQFNTFKTK